jgi:hypothetical protein
MTADAMMTLRAKRKIVGLVQKNIWLRREDIAEFERAVKPLKVAAREAIKDSRSAKLPMRRLQIPKIFEHRISFPKIKPPAALRAQLKDLGWEYDRDVRGNVWFGAWDISEKPRIDKDIQTLCDDYHAVSLNT